MSAPLADIVADIDGDKSETTVGDGIGERRVGGENVDGLMTAVAVGFVEHQQGRSQPSVIREPDFCAVASSCGEVGCRRSGTVFHYHVAAVFSGGGIVASAGYDIVDEG